MSDQGMTVAEAAAVYGISISTVRRLLTSRRLEGARRVSGPKGVEYRIPASAFESLGYRPTSTGPATVRSERAEAELARLGEELAATRDELDGARHRAELAGERATLLETSLSDLRTAVARVPEAEPERGGRRREPGAARGPSIPPWWLGALLVATVATVVLALVARRDVSVNVQQSSAPPAVASTIDVAPTVSTTPVAPSSTAAATTAAPTTAAPTTAAPTTVAPQTTMAPSTTSDPLPSAREAYSWITARWNPVLARLDRDYGRLTEHNARDICALLANAYEGAYLDLQAAAWPDSVQGQIDRLVLAAASLRDELRRCAATRRGWAALTIGTGPQVKLLSHAVGLAATDARLVLGLPATPGVPLPARGL